ncbi:IclR family transcriptional regulator [Paenibacillus tianjinensis]|uniref:IclR family transcriptional regulator n=1 Tax=Paenibacillus tianjinensis TaxID=2810347 RepID=A0ABX7LH68_9BACL|nr:IclR family transcriptional regulator [Paenibacillus tianjinensis]QSF47454.1 IclR family transcriptional regulator [Paenibacillus tianjinensis]
MDRKYWVPALERANLILTAISRHPGEFKMTDLCETTGINKSSMFSLLRTMETLNWVKRNEEDAYVLGAGIAYFNTAFNDFSKRNYNLVERFLQASVDSVKAVGETFQLSVLDRNEIIYLAKQEGASLVKLESSPGMRFPAHATAMGKMMLAMLPPQELEKRYPDRILPTVTSNTVTDWEDFRVMLTDIRSRGFSEDHEEIIQGICCVAAPVTNVSGDTVAAVSTSMMRHAYLEKQEEAIHEVIRLGKKLSQL